MNQAQLQRRRPITLGIQTIEEVARFRAEGLTEEAIAQAWNMRPLAGADDLKYEITRAWERAGSPGTPTRPAQGDPYHEEWRIWGAGRKRAIEAWLRAMARGEPMPEADVVRMNNLEREVLDLRTQISYLVVDPPTDPCVYQCGALGIRPVPRANQAGSGPQEIWGYACMECLKRGKSRNIGVRVPEPGVTYRCTTEGCSRNRGQVLRLSEPNSNLICDRCRRPLELVP